MNIQWFKSMTDRLFAEQARLASDQEARRLVASDAEFVLYGVKKEVERILQKELKRFSEIRVEDTPWVKVDIAKRLLEMVAMIYKTQPTRKIGTDPEAPAAVKFQEILAASDIAAAAPRWDMLARLHNVVGVRPVWHTNPDRLEFRIYTPAHSDVIPREDDYLLPELFQYYVDRTPLGTTKTNVHVWTADEAYMIDETARMRMKPLPGADTTENPYGEIPVAWLRLEDTGTFWGEGLTDLVDAQVAWMAQFAALLKNGWSQGFSIPLFLNMGLGNTVAAGSEIGGAKPVKVGSDMGFAVDGVEKNDGKLPPSITYATPDPKLQELTAVCNTILHIACWRMGLNQSRAVDLIAGAVGGEAPSGVAKSLDNADIEEIRSKHLETYRRFERELYRLTAKVLKVDAGIVLPEDAEFSIDFADQQVKLTFAEVKERREHEFKFNLSTPADWAREDNKDLDDKAALKKIADNTVFNESIRTSNVVRDTLSEDDPAQG